MKDFKNEQIEGAEALVGRTVMQIRAKSPDGGTAIQRLVFLLDDGSSLTVDGGFPACSHMTSPEDSLLDIEGKRFDGFACRSLKPRRVGDGCWETDLMLTVTADGDEHTLHWAAVGRDGFDVTPAPRVHVRASPHPA